MVLTALVISVTDYLTAEPSVTWLHVYPLGLVEWVVLNVAAFVLGFRGIVRLYQEGLAGEEELAIASDLWWWLPWIVDGGTLVMFGLTVKSYLSSLAFSLFTGMELAMYLLGIRTVAQWRRPTGRDET